MILFFLFRERAQERLLMKLRKDGAKTKNEDEDSEFIDREMFPNNSNNNSGGGAVKRGIVANRHIITTS